MSDTSNVQSFSEFHNDSNTILASEAIELSTPTDNSLTDITPSHPTNPGARGDTLNKQQKGRVLPPRTKREVPPERYSPTRVTHTSRYPLIYHLTTCLTLLDGSLCHCAQNRYQRQLKWHETTQCGVKPW